MGSKDTSGEIFFKLVARMDDGYEELTEIKFEDKSSEFIYKVFKLWAARKIALAGMGLDKSQLAMIDFLVTDAMVKGVKAMLAELTNDLSEAVTERGNVSYLV